MKTYRLLPLLLLATAALAQEPPAPAAGEVFDPKALDVLRPKKGQIVTLEGTLVATGQNKAGTIRYLNFTQNYRESVGLIFRVSKNPDFTMEKLGEWVGKKVRVHGTISEFQGNLQIAIDKFDQLKVVEEAKPAEPAK
jgi:hypothetical protein